MERQSRTEAQLVELVVKRTYKLLGQRRPKVMTWYPEVRLRFGKTPNWDINCGIMPPDFLDAFVTAAAEVKAKYDLERASEPFGADRHFSAGG